MNLSFMHLLPAYPLLVCFLPAYLLSAGLLICLPVCPPPAYLLPFSLVHFCFHFGRLHLACPQPLGKKMTNCQMNMS